MRCIAVFTHSGFTARLVSRYRPLVPVIAFSPETEIRRSMALIWGVMAAEIENIRTLMVWRSLRSEFAGGALVRKGDVIGIVAGTPMGVRGTTNFMKFHVMGGE